MDPIADADELPELPEPDPIRRAIGALLEALIEATAPGSRERARAMSEALEVHARILSAMAGRRTLN
jgi:hypothetical protein